MGGTHTTEAYYTEKVNVSGNGDVAVLYGNLKSTVTSVRIAGAVANAFKRDEAFQKLGRNIACTKESPASSMFANSIITSGASHYEKMGMLSSAADMKRLPLSECKKIAAFLNRIIAYDYPPSDAKIYEQAKTLMAKENSADLQQAANRFSMIKDYLDAEELLKQTLTKYEVVLQEEKERKILDQEARTAKRAKVVKKWLPVFIGVAVALVVLLGAGGFMIKTNIERKQAEKEAASAETMEHLIGKTYYRGDGLSITFKEDGTAVGKWRNGYYSTYEVLAEEGNPVKLTFNLIPEKSKVDSDDPVSYATWDRENDEINYGTATYKYK